MYSETNLKKLILKDTTGIIEERHPLFLYFLAIIIGIISTFLTIGFIFCYEYLRKVIYISKTVDFVSISESTPFWYFFVVLVLGGALIGLFIYYIIPYHGHGHGMPHLLYRFKHIQYITIREGISATFASIASLAMGAAVGREGPIMFLAGSAASWFCQFFKLNGHYLRVLLSASIACSLATSVHSTFVGIFFVLEIVSFSITTLDLLPIATAIAISAIIRKIFPLILPPSFYLLKVQTDFTELPYFIVLGLIAGFLAILFSESLKYTVRSHYNNPLPKWIWPIFGGLGLTFFAIYIPEVMGIGFDRLPLSPSITEVSIKIVTVMLIAKLIATYLSIGFGFSGGIISPVFISGMILGTLYGTILQNVFPAQEINFHLYALAATAAFTAVIIGGPLTMVMLTFEVTQNINMSLNTFVCVFFAMLVMKTFKVQSFFQSQYLFLYAD